MMELRTYRKQSNLTQAAFAALVSTHQAVISEIEAGKTLPTLTIAYEIERVTDGAVPMRGWIDRQRAIAE